MRPESWPPKNSGVHPWWNNLPADDGPLLVDRDRTRWGACGDCGQEPVYMATHQCPPTISPTSAVPSFSAVRGGPVVPAQRAPEPATGHDRANTGRSST